MARDCVYFKRNINDIFEYLSSKYFIAWGWFWSIAGYITQDKPVLANFGLQIPLFAIGFSKVLFGF